MRDSSLGQTAALDSILTECLTSTVGGLFNKGGWDHPFLNLKVDVVKVHIPVRWVEDITIDEVVFTSDGPHGGFDLDEHRDHVGGTTHHDLPLSAASWTQEQGPRKLADALKRLDLPDDVASSRHHAAERMRLKELGDEKKRVKQELKRYDSAFKERFKRLPSRTEKEPMRPLYTYYRKLKTLMVNAGGDADDGGGHDSAEDDSRRDRGNPSRRGSGRDVRNPRSVGSVLEDLDEQMPLDVAGLESQRDLLEQRLATLSSDKNIVRNKLQAYQEKFFADNARKIRFHKDILPIEREYRQYKKLKEEITKIETQLKREV